MVSAWGTSSGGVYVSADSLPSETSFKKVLYQHPFQFFQSGFKIAVDFNIKDRMIVNVYGRHIFSNFPRFYTLDEDDNGLGIEFIPDYLNDANLGMMIKNSVGKNGSIYNGFYFMTFIESGRGWESYWTRLASFFPKIRHVNTYNYRKFGVGFGRQWTVFNSSVIDVNFGFGFYDMSGEAKRVYRPFPIFDQPEDQAYVFGSLAMGIGNKSKKRISSNWRLVHGITFDFNAVLKNSIEPGILFGNSTKGLWHVHMRYGSHEFGEINVTDAETFTNVAIGAQYRYYPTADLRKEGLYFAGGYTSSHTKATILEKEHGANPTRRNFVYDPQRISFTMGFTTYLNNRYLLGGYISNNYTFSPGRTSKVYIHPDEATGIHTMIGLKLGFVKMQQL
jgi:hypothetical protein